MKTLVLGIGNEILGDDGVGIHVVREVARRVDNDKINFKETGVAGLNLVELVRGYDRLIVSDAILTKNTDSGHIHRLDLEDISEQSQLLSPHSAGLRTMLDIGHRLFPGEMPEQVVIYAVEANDTDQVTDTMSKAVREAVPRVVSNILKDL